LAWLVGTIITAPAGAGSVAWERAVYYDASYPWTWAGSAPLWVRDVLAADGYDVVDATELRTWMDDRISDGLPAVVVFSQDVAPDTVLEEQSSQCTLRRYLDAGGKIVWFGDVPLYYQGHAGGGQTVWGVDGSINVLGFNAAGGAWDGAQDVSFTPDGTAWGLTDTWPSQRPALPAGLRVLAEDTEGNAAAWVRHYVAEDTHRGFVRFRDTPDIPNVDDLRRLAEFPNVPAPVLGENPEEQLDDIVCAFVYPWYGNPGTTGHWEHWEADGHNPPLTWSANYAPDYPDSTWNPAVQLYDSNDTEVLRWQDRAMARAGIDIAVSSWWGVGDFSDQAFAKAIYTAKSVRWCIYYELDSYGNPTAGQIYSDIKYVLDSYTPFRNYAQIDGKWLVMVYSVSGEEPAGRWQAAKELLAADGYEVYFNAAGDPAPSMAPDPWDAVHSYNPIQRTTLTTSLANVDDSHSISPGFWFYHEAPVLVRDLGDFSSALAFIADQKEQSRFVMVETWNEWHEGTSIEPGQEVIHDDVFGFAPAADYAFDYVDAVGPTANAVKWQTPGHRPHAPPARLEAEAMVWEPGSEAEGPAAWRLVDDGARIGAGLETAGLDVMVVVRARAALVGGPADWPQLVLYWDDAVVATWPIETTEFGIRHHAVGTAGGVHRIEVGLAGDPGGAGDVDLVVDYVDVLAVGDIDGDGTVGIVDFLMLLGSWGPCSEACLADLDGDGAVGITDFLIMLANWG
jgi:hypothetical protein